MRKYRFCEFPCIVSRIHMKNIGICGSMPPRSTVPWGLEILTSKRPRKTSQMRSDGSDLPASLRKKRLWKNEKSFFHSLFRLKYHSIEVSIDARRGRRASLYQFFIPVPPATATRRRRWAWPNHRGATSPRSPPWGRRERSCA